MASGGKKRPRTRAVEPEASAPPAPNAPACRPAPWWVKVFVLFHVVVITIYALPLPPGDMRDGKRAPRGSDWILYDSWKYGKACPVVQTYALGTGFWQYWDMFAPDPIQWDDYGTATVIYKDGKTVEWQYPRMSVLPIPKKFLQERYRKFFERVHDYTDAGSDGKGYVAQRVAQRIALIEDIYPGNPPDEVKLYLHRWNIPPPGEALVPKYKTTPYFDYIVDQNQLEKDKAGQP